VDNKGEKKNVCMNVTGEQNSLVFFHVFIGGMYRYPFEMSKGKKEKDGGFFCFVEFYREKSYIDMHHKNE
jgi:hypothetical protein